MLSARGIASQPLEVGLGRWREDSSVGTTMGPATPLRPLWMWAAMAGFMPRAESVQHTLALYTLTTACPWPLGSPGPGTSVVKFARSVARGFGAAVAGRASTTAAASIVRTTVANNRLDFKVITPPSVGDPLHTTHTLNVLYAPSNHMVLLSLRTSQNSPSTQSAEYTSVGGGFQCG